MTPSPSVSVVKLSTGDYVLSYRLVPTGMLAVFSARGALRRAYERTGSGPGEFQEGPLLALGPGDTIYAFHRQYLTRLDRNLAHINTRNLPLRLRQGTVVLANGVLVTDARHRMRDGRVTLAQLLPRGDSIHPIDFAPPALAAGGGVTTLLAPSGLRAFWTLRNNDSELRLNSHTGTLTRSVTISREWFRPWSVRTADEGQTVPPRPANAWLSELAGGILLVGTRVADAQWKSPFVQGRVNILKLDLTPLYDTQIEAVDATSGSVLAVLRNAHDLGPVIGTNDEFVSTRFDEDGHVLADIWRVRFVQGNRAVKQ